MAVKRIAPNDFKSRKKQQSLWLIWKNPETGRYFRVGELDHFEDESYSFRYLPEALVAPDFHALTEFPEMESVYLSDTLPAFFANRVMSADRANYSLYRSWLGLTQDGWDTPMEVLARSGGSRATDTFHVVEKPGQHSKVISRFFISGMRHKFSGQLELLVAGQELYLRAEPDNPHNPSAMLLEKDDDEPVGWLPDWLVDTVRESGEISNLQVFIEQVNESAPSRLKVLCRLEFA